ncbi:MAG: GAF domain-containing protein [Halobacteriales archaeon]
MSARDWPLPSTLFVSILFASVQIPYILVAGLAAQTPMWGRVVALVFPAVTLTAYIWYVRRYSAHQDRDLLFKYAGRGSIIGGAVYTLPGIGLILQQRVVELPILNPDVLILELWLGGGLIGLVAGHLYAETQAEKARIEQLLGATQDIILGSDREDIAERTVTAAEHILGLDTSAIYTPESETVLEPIAATEGTADLFGYVPTIDSQDAIAWSAYNSGDPMYVDDVRDHPDAYNPETPVRTEMLIPISEIGVFITASTEVDDLNQTDRALAQVLISNAEAAMKRATNEAALREREQKIERLQERSQRLMYTQTRTETARVAVEAARDVIGALLSGVHFLNETGDTLKGDVMTEAVHETFSDVPDYHRDHEDGSSDAIVWEAFERDEPLYIEDTRDYQPLTEEPKTRCVLVYPLGDHGIFIASSKQPSRFDEIDQTLFGLLVPVLTAALDRVEREQTLQRREERLEQHRQRLTVLNRVLRHDIRTQANLIIGGVSKLEHSVDDVTALTTIESAVSKIAELSKNARRIEETINSSKDITTAVDLTEIVEACIEELNTKFTQVNVQSDIPSEVYVDSNGLLEAAVENVLDNAVEHNDSSPPEVDVTVDTEPDDVVVVRIADNGPGIPEHEQDVFKQKDESQLRHSSGLGLWLVHWIIDDLNGVIEIEDRSPHGTVVELRVPQSKV